MIEFTADKLKITGPKVDGSYSVTFEAGEYTQNEIAKLFSIPQGKTMTVKVEYE